MAKIFLAKKVKVAFLSAEKKISSTLLRKKGGKMKLHKKVELNGIGSGETKTFWEKRYNRSFRQDS